MDKRKAPFEPGSAPPKKMALLASAPDSPSPQPQAPSAHSSMNANVLQRQNLNLQTSLEQKRRELDELKRKFEKAERNLLVKEEAVSVLDRHWHEMESQTSLLLERVHDEPKLANPDDALGGLLQQLAAPAPLAPGDLDAKLKGRTQRFVQLLTRVVQAVASIRAEQQELLQALKNTADPTSAMQAATRAQEMVHADAKRAEALSVRLQSEQSGLAAQLHATRDKLTLSERAQADLQEHLDQCRSELERSTKELNRQRQRLSQVGSAAPTPAPAAPTAVAPADATAASAAIGDQTTGPEGAQAEITELKEELNAIRALAEQRLVQMQQTQHEADRLRMQAQELSERPVGEEQLRSNPKFAQLSNQVQQWSEQARQGEQSVARLRTELAEVNKSRHQELQRFENMRMQQREETGQEAQRASKQMAQMRTERDSLELQLGQKALGQQALVHRTKELESMLALCKGEMERSNSETQRVRAQLAEREKDRDDAIEEKERQREAAHSAELQIQQLTQRLKESMDGSGPPPELQDVEKRCQEALVRLGSAEQSALQAQQALASMRGECTALQAEVSAISEAFEQVQGQNARLLEQVQQKDEASTKLVAERLRAEQGTALLRAERKALEDKAGVADKLKGALDELRSSLEGQNKLAREALGKKEEEQRHLHAMVEKHKKDARDAQVEMQSAGDQLKFAQEAAKRATERESKQAATAKVDAAQLKRLEQERDTLQRRVARLGAAGKDATAPASSEAEEQLAYYRRMVKCTLCKENEKNAIIVKCCHTFCRSCIDERLANRNRKCPACSQQFDYQSVRELYLTN